MPIVQIAQIKHRRGLRDQLPTALEEGELGLALDTGELFIGTPGLPQAAARTAFPYANTRVLTEWTPALEEVLRHVYRQRQIGFDPTDATEPFEPLPPGADPDTQTTVNPTLFWRDGTTYHSVTVRRALQERLDDVVSVKAWGARGDGTRDLSSVPSSDARYAETQALRIAALDAASTNNSASTADGWHRRALLFPAGVYVVSDSIVLPPGSTWLGEGRDNTVIALWRDDDPTVGQNDCLMFTVDGTLDAAAYLTQANTDPLALPGLLQNAAYANIDPSSPPQDIVVRGITFVIGNQGPSSIVHDVVRLIRGARITFEDCAFVGLYAGGKGLGSDYDPNTDSVAVVMDGIGTATTTGNVRFVDCVFSDVTYGTILTDDVFDIRFENCVFERCFRGISMGEGLGAISKGTTVKTLTFGLDGPVAVSAIGCDFRNIEKEGASTWRFESNDRSSNSHFAGTHGLMVAFSRFYNVGNGSFAAANDTNQYWCVYFSPSTIYNIAVGNVYSRNQSIEDAGSTGRRVYAQPGSSNIVLDAQSFAILPERMAVLAANTLVPTSTGIAIDLSMMEAATIEYTLKDVDGAVPGAPFRRGRFRIVTDGVSITWDDDFIVASGPDTITLTAQLVGPQAHVMFTNTNPTNKYHINYRVRFGHVT